jgi:hypothetical protein
MRKLITMIMACGGIAISSVPSLAAQPQQHETFCYRGGPVFCAPTTEHRYEACGDLAVERGWARRGSRGFDRFVYECLTGTIGTAPGTAPN